MANDFTAFFERLTAASGEFNAATVGQLGFIDAVYKDVRPEVARVGQTIRVPYPDAEAFTDQGLNGWTPTDKAAGYKEVVIGNRPGKAFLVHDFEQFQTASDLIQNFIDPHYKRAAEYANGAIAAAITSTNFNVIPVFQSSVVGGLGIADAANAWDALVDQKVPVTDQSNAALVMHNNVHRYTMTASEWAAENQVGAAIAMATRQNGGGGAAAQTFNFRRVFDQQAPVTMSANLTGTVALTNGSAAVTGTGTQFQTELAVGAVIQFQGETTFYRVASIASATSMTLAQLYAGTTQSGRTYQRRTYITAAIHKHAMCLAMRPLPLVNNGQVTSRLMIFGGVPMRVQVSYQHQLGGYLVTVDFAMGVAVLRPNFAALIRS